jgi:HD-GYP domain-containing protein (c-di-GMP phosphodiesterase class II)
MALELLDAGQIEFEHRLLEYNIRMAQMLGTAITMRDHGTGAHNLRVALYAGAFGEELGFDRRTLRNLIAGAFLHDIGKISIPDRILLKTGNLSDDETRVMREHCGYGAQLIGEFPAFAGAIPVVRHHHERYDGNGYPSRLAGERIPIIARAFAIIDVFDALVSDRPYKRALPWREAANIIDAATGAHFDPGFILPFLHLVPTVYLKFGSLSVEGLKLHVAQLRLRHFGM